MSSGPNGQAEYRLSIVIPVINEQEQINDCLERLAEQRFDGRYQTIVVDGDPLGSTIQVVQDHRLICLTSDPGRGRQMNAGAAAAAGDILLFLHVDTSLPPGALASVDATMQANGCVGGAFELGIDSERPFLKYIAARANRRSHRRRIPYGDQAIFLSRTYFQAIGGFREIPIMEDLDLMIRIKRHGGKIHILDQRVMTSARRWEAEGALYTTARNKIIRMLFHLGVPPEMLARFYSVQSRIVRRNGEVRRQAWRTRTVERRRE